MQQKPIKNQSPEALPGYSQSEDTLALRLESKLSDLRAGYADRFSSLRARKHASKRE